MKTRKNYQTIQKGLNRKYLPAHYKETGAFLITKYEYVLPSARSVDYHHHIKVANEGNAVGIAAGYHLATGKIPVVYTQDSGEGNAINPLASLLNEKVYAIPCIFIIGWRVEPGNIVKASGEDLIISTTGKASRELFETRTANGQSHKYDFLTVGSIAVIGANKPNNLVHVVINNSAHESVGGMPTVASQINLVAIAKACGYPNAVCVDNFEDLDHELEVARSREELCLIEVKCSVGTRKDLGCPTTTASENKRQFMEYLKHL